MVLTKDELIGSLKNEVRILLHLAGKVDRAKLDYRPTPKQRSTLELLRYLAIMGPAQIAVIRTGIFDRPNISAAWGPAEKAASAMDFDAAVAAIGKQSDQYERLLSDWTEADLRSEVDVFGQKFSRGRLLVDHVIASHAAYRTQLFCYLKACGREELNTVNLWAGVDTMAAP
ncbi:MAG TPA: hypothetical protein VGF59_23920 [Bryobacteraceae bacterium]|jgi:hypothetical protein